MGALGVLQEAQQASLNGLMQRYHMAEQQRQMQRQQAMQQQMGQASSSAGSMFMQSSQHLPGGQLSGAQKLQQIEWGCCRLICTLYDPS